ncbi:GWxTD domain-containing protein [Gemmatimonas sp.]|uniref:GWxTD domain-containing protein n=1 Tax=Gemmatimonas sp. TaxID=1962908 RepID=UPI00286D8B37|nr:GWxTD domain-containing protein [Gemmatimonas sp.]
MPHGIARRRMLADSGFALAIEYEPDSVRWAVDYADFLFRSDVVNFQRATGVLRSALRRAERGTDDRLSSIIADRIGLLEWRRYEIVAQRRMTEVNPNVRLGEFIKWPKLYRQFRQMESQPLTPPLGLERSAEARAFFQRALTSNPHNALAFRHLAMTMAERREWLPLDAAASQFQRDNPKHPWGALVRGLALHRLGRTAEASRHFDDGIAMLPPNDAQVLFAINRVMLPKDTAKLSTLSDSARASLEKTFWGVADPSRLIAGNLVQSEFRARVVHAELRWSNEETERNGVDSDRGVVFVRWGPPDDVAGYKDSWSADVLEFWDYEQLDANFLFHALPTYGTARINQFYRGNVLEHLEALYPAVWRNLEAVREVARPIDLRAYRFRARGDSNAMAVIATIPTGAWHATASTNSTATVALAVFDPSWRLADSTSTRLDLRTTDSMSVSAVQFRMTLPSSATFLRADALAAGSNRASKAIADLPPRSSSGFDVSDLLIARELRTSSPAPNRWSDFAITPLVGGAITSGQPIDVLWEIYGLSESAGQARYRISLVVEQLAKNGAVAVAVRALSGLRNAVTGTEGARTIRVSFARESEYRPTIVEQLKIGLGDLTPGNYRMRIEITDDVSGQSRQQVQPFAVRKR